MLITDTNLFCACSTPNLSQINKTESIPTPSNMDDDNDSLPSLDGDDEDTNMKDSINRDRLESIGLEAVVNDMFQVDGWVKAKSPDGYALLSSKL